MKNKFGETVKPQYEVYIYGWSQWCSIEAAIANHDIEVFSYICADSYREAAKAAKSMSLKKGQVYKGEYGKREIVDVSIVCYFSDDTSDYNPAWEEFYENGKKLKRCDF